MNTYGFEVGTLEQLVSMPIPAKKEWGSQWRLLSVEGYVLERLEIAKGQHCHFNRDGQNEVTIFVETGVVEVNGRPVGNQEVMEVSLSEDIDVTATEKSDVFCFYGPAEKRGDYFAKRYTTDVRKKYWGTIETIVSKSYVGKRMFCEKGMHSSLEFHCKKVEGYYVHSGILLVRLRAGRGEDRFFELAPGKAMFIPPGLMHQRGAIEDAVIIEISTRDEDSDSFLVEDGQTHVMPNLASSTDMSRKEKRVVFDLDGCLCTQTTGDYEIARPIPEAIATVNRLYADGYKIIIHTARMMNRNQHNMHAAYEEGYEFTKRQLRQWGASYHMLMMGKPPADVVVDDRGVFFRNDWNLIERDIRNKLKES